MKKLLPTVLLVLVLIAGWMYARSENFFREEEKPASALFTLQSGDVESFRIGSGEGAVELKRNGDGWEMVKPAAYPVQKYAADGLAESLADLKIKGVIDENPPGLADFGLDQPVQEVEARLKDGSAKKLLVGSPLPVAGTTYVKAADSAAVYEMADSVLNRLTKTAEDFLDKNVFAFQYDQIKSVEMEWRGGKWTLTKTEPAKKTYESAWKIGDKELKPEEGTAILDKLTFLTTDRLPKTKSEMDWTGAQLKLTVKQEAGGSETALAYTGKVDNELVRIAKSDGSWAYAVAASDIQAIFDLGSK